MATELIINATLPETRIALLENSEIQELHIERDSERGIVGNIYKGKVIRVLPGMQAAFVDIGLEKAAFLYVDDIYFPDMRTPLSTQPLPEVLPKPLPQPIEGAKSGVQSGPRAEKGRGRGRSGRWSAESEKPTAAPIPGSPEDHARLQREYARQMLEMDSDEQVGGEEGQEVVPQELGATPMAQSEDSIPEEAVAPIAASVNPEDSVQHSQPEARSPQAEEIEPVEPLDEDEDEVESAAVYRPEPLIDADAWADDISPDEVSDVAIEPKAESVSEAVTFEAEAVIETVNPEAQEGAELASAQSSEEKSQTELSTPAQMEDAKSVSQEPPVAPLATPVTSPVTSVDDDEDEDDEESEMPRRRRRREQVNIQDLVKEGQEILVQVAKDPIGTKGARLTCHVSLPGRYLVFMPTVDHIGVSRRIESESERRRLKETMSKIRPPKTGVIVRTASGKQTDKKLKQDLDYLVTTWNDIQKKFNKQRTPSVVYTDLTIVLRAIRDMFTDEVDRVVVDSKREHKSIMRFVSRFIPQVKDKVELYQGDMPIFDYYGVETEISRALDRKVWLKSGGYLVVDQAEALVAIDVNTGRYVGKKTLEETILKTNLEAVKEIAYQLRLRNCGGIIILDLIDMEKESNREKVYKALEEALKKDRARPSILKISQLGLIEMTRKRTRDSMVRSLCEPCSYCDGSGFVKNKLTISYDIMRDIEREGVVAETSAISIQCHPSVADVLLEDKRDVLEDMERQFRKKITIRGNGAYHVEQYELVAHREGKNVVWSSEERQSLVRQKIQERSQHIAAEQRKQAEQERQERRREQEERKKEQERLRAERRAQAEERRKQAAAARQAAFEEQARASVVAQGLDLTTPEGEEAYKTALAAVAAANRSQSRHHHRAFHDNNSAESRSQDKATVGPDGQPEGDRERDRDRGRRRRRGRRGRGGRRDRDERRPSHLNQSPNVVAVGSAGEALSPVTGEQGSHRDDFEGPKDTFDDSQNHDSENHVMEGRQDREHEYQGGDDRAESSQDDDSRGNLAARPVQIRIGNVAPRSAGATGATGAPTAPGEGQAAGDMHRRRRRRGRRGGRRRRRFGPPGAQNNSEGNGNSYSGGPRTGSSSSSSSDGGGNSGGTSE